MELLDGHNLEDWLKARTEPVTVREVVWVARDTLLGLEAAHKQRLIHRDVKPTNLWVEAGSNRIKLLDFGISRRPGVDPTITGTGDIVGSSGYMPLEQARGQKVDGRATCSPSGPSCSGC